MFASVTAALPVGTLGEAPLHPPGIVDAQLHIGRLDALALVAHGLRDDGTHGLGTEVDGADLLHRGENSPVAVAVGIEVAVALEIAYHIVVVVGVDLARGGSDGAIEIGEVGTIVFGSGYIDDVAVDLGDVGKEIGVATAPRLVIDALEGGIMYGEGDAVVAVFLAAAAHHHQRGEDYQGSFHGSFLLLTDCAPTQ